MAGMVCIGWEQGASMMLNKVLAQMGHGASVSLQEIADCLLEDTGTIKHAVTILNRLGYCEQIRLAAPENNCAGCRGDACVSISGLKATYWQLTRKGVGYLDRQGG